MEYRFKSIHSILNRMKRSNRFDLANSIEVLVYKTNVNTQPFLREKKWLTLKTRAQFPLNITNVTRSFTSIENAIINENVFHRQTKCQHAPHR